MARAKGLSQQAGPVKPKRGQFAGITFQSFRQLQNARAQAKGHKSHAVRLATPRKLAAPLLSDAERFKKSAAGRANMAVLKLRSDPGLTLAQAAKRAGTTPAAVHRYAGRSIDRVGNRIQAKTQDSALAEMSVVTPDGPVAGIVKGSKTRDLIGQHHAWMNAASHAPSKENRRELAKFSRRYVTFADSRRVNFVSTVEQLQRLVRLGLFDNSGPYDTENLPVAA